MFGSTPDCTAAIAVNGLKVEPAGYRPVIARLNCGVVFEVVQVRRWPRFAFTPA